MKINTKFISNPFLIHIFSFALALALCSLGWSGLYPAFEIDLILFLIFTFLLSIIFFWFEIKVNKVPATHNSLLNYKSTVWTAGLINILYVASYAFSGGIPLFRISAGDLQYDIYKFGLPGIHVFLLTFSSFFCVYLYGEFLAQKRYFFLLLSSSIVIHLILIVNRSSTLFVISSCAFLYFWQKKNIAIQKLLLSLSIALCILYAFGELGNRRILFQIEQETGVADSSIEDVLLNLADATPVFTQTKLPATFLWAYLYISSPIANLQYTLKNYPRQADQRFPLLVTDAILPDTFGKPLHDLLNLEDIDRSKYISESLWVGTTFYSPYYAYGWPGMVIFSLIYFFVIFLYLLFTNKSSIKGVSRAIVCTLVLFGIFDDMLAYSPMSLQLIYPIIFIVFQNLKDSFHRNAIKL